MAGCQKRVVELMVSLCMMSKPVLICFRLTSQQESAGNKKCILASPLVNRFVKDLAVFKTVVFSATGAGEFYAGMRYR